MPQDKFRGVNLFADKIIERAVEVVCKVYKSYERRDLFVSIPIV